MDIVKPIKTREWTPEAIKSLRTLHGLTQDEMASIIGMTQQCYARMEKGKHKLGRMTEIALEKVSEYLKDNIVCAR